MQLKRFVFFCLVSGIVTILCHAGIYASHARIRGAMSDDQTVPGTGDDGAKKPSTHDDHASTMKGTPVTINVLQNDGKGEGDDDDNDEENKDDDEIDASTVDLDPPTQEIDKTRNTPKGDYTVNDSGDVTYVPAPDFTGVSSIQYTVNNKKGETSKPARLNITVTDAASDPPVITGQNPDPLTTDEDQPITLSLNNLVVTDSDSNYPNGFTLQVQAGSNYTVSGTTVTPGADFSGTLSVPVTVNDGENNSTTFNLQIAVAPSNDAPVITGQQPNPLTTGEDQPITVQTNHLLVSDPDNTYPNGFSLTLTAGSGYTVSGTTVTPAADFTGTLAVPVTVSDGQATSNTFSLSILVSGTNDPPQITGQSPLSVDEDNSLTIIFSNLQVSDNDNTYPDGFTIALGAGPNYTVSGTTITPAGNYSGTLSVPVTVNDGTSSSAPFALQISVNAINDAPVITAQAQLATAENQPLQLDLSHFTVADADNPYPAGFTLSVSPGQDYTVSGTTITPAPGFSGTLSVGISVSDGTASSAVFSAQVTVNPVNDPPVITGQNALSVNEDTQFTLLLSNLTVSDTDNSYPAGFTLTVLPGTGYSVSGNTVTPGQNFTGTLSVSVVVNDGASDSAPFPVQVSVMPVNDAPQITGQQPLSTMEDQSLLLELQHVVVTDPDNAWPAGFTLLVSPGANYALSGTTITPLPNFQGTLTVPVQVNDGALNSNVFQLQIAVTPVNDTPVITGQLPLGTQEDVPVTIQLSHLVVMDSDSPYPSGFTLSVSPGDHYTVSGTTVTPALDYTGTLNVGVTVSDGSTSSPLFVFQIQVGDTNDPPVITGQAALSINEEQAFTLGLEHVTVADPDNPYPSGFTLLVASGANFTVTGTTITPALNFAGQLVVPVRVNDGVNNSPTFNLQIQVNQVNDPPGFSAIAGQRIPENTVSATVAITGISKGPGENDQQLTFIATSGNTSLIPDPVISYSPASTTATLVYKPVANASGMVTITVIAIDNGSNVAPNQNSYAASFQVEIVEINSAPTLDAITSYTIPEDAALQSISLHGITAGAGENQPLTIGVSTDKPELFEVLEVLYTSPGATGTLQVKPKPNAFGMASITVKVTDNGSSVAPSVNTISRTFTFTIQPVNDLPVFTSTPVTVAAVNELYEYIAEISDVESNALPFSAPVKPAWASLTALGNGKAKLSGIPPSSAAGTTPVKIVVTDGGANVEQPYSLIVNNRPLTAPLVVSVQEDQAYTFQSLQITNLYADTDHHPFSAMLVTQKPGFGRLLLAGRELKAGDTIAAASVGSLVYEPGLNYAGLDAFYWKAGDAYHFSAAAAPVNIDVLPVNDGPSITLETDSLQYEVNGEPAFITSLFDADDPDDDSLARAEIGFRTQNYRPDLDMLLFENTANIKGFYDFQAGKLSLTGLAPIEEYERAIRSIRYNHLNTLDPTLELKTVFFTLHDGKVWGETRERTIRMQYTFIELEIPSGFTPNGDNANDTWVITRPGGLEQLTKAVIKVYNKRGVQVFFAEGFNRTWDGTLNGEMLPADTYFYSIDLNLRSKKTYKGIVTILR